MKKYIYSLVMALLLVSCAKVPLTNRKQMNMIPESQMVSMSLTQYSEFLSKNPPVAATDANAKMVKDVGARISGAVSSFLNSKKMGDRIKGYKWEFNLVNSKEINAWCMPGGKVVVYTGLLPVTKDEAGLAFVMGHEVAHAVARHGNERMSQMLLAEAGGVALDVYMANKPEQTRAMYQQAYGIGSAVGVMLPFSRMHESEADKLGMIFMALAGYDPAVAPKVWQRMIDINKGEKPPELLSTHPSDEKRIAEIKKYIPEAKKYYKPR